MSIVRVTANRLSASARPALGASVALWTFGLTLVAVLTALQGRGTIWIQAPIQAAFWVAAIALAAGLYAIWRRIQALPVLFRWLLVAAACGAAGAVQTSVDVLLLAWLADTWFPSWRSWATLDVPRVASVWILYTWTFGLNAALFWVLSANDEARRQAIRAADAEAAAQNAQLALLRLQLNPHFLFNTLNAISGLMLEDDIAGADRMLNRLSEFLRASLDIEPTALTPLGDELNTVDAYLQIEAVRFEGRLTVTYECPDALRAAQVPSFILQPLVENAMKHAVAPALRPIRLTIAARARDDILVLTVSDDGDPPTRGRPVKGPGVGLRNVEARLATLYGRRGVLSTRPLEAGFNVELSLPLTYAAAPDLAAQ